MPLAPLFVLALLAAEPPPADSVVTTAPPAAGAPAPKVDAAPAAAGPDDIPPGAPSDDYGLVAWCYGALGEYLTIYDDIKPDLKAIDKMFGTPVVEAEPYHEDIAAARLAEKRFAAAMEAAEKASPKPIGPYGAASIDKGRSIWSLVQMKTRRNMVDAWLFWGVPNRCETTAKALKMRSSLLGQALAASAPAAEAPVKPEPAPEAAAGDKTPPPGVHDPAAAGGANSIKALSPD
jgi:hypothetical protein